MALKAPLSGFQFVLHAISIRAANGLSHLCHFRACSALLRCWWSRWAAAQGTRSTSARWSGGDSGF
eukprot:37026-Eustigmatos_ZCMA.PRE.1